MLWFTPLKQEDHTLLNRHVCARPWSQTLVLLHTCQLFTRATLTNVYRFSDSYSFFSTISPLPTPLFLVPRQGIEPAPPAVEVRSPNHWTAREFPLFSFLFYLKNFYLFIYFWLHRCVRAFSSCGEQGLLFIAVRRLLIAVASLVAEQGL